ncbi:MAG: IS66 family insertion sequence element accessory protein TnpB [Oscillospiraceae bacterium]|nr:IS66 family insertion sequence element accessory protein TnpB [Oscillospiraceae bacterium]
MAGVPVLNFDLFSTALFLFCGRRQDRIKSLLLEYDFFLLVSFLIFQTKPTPRS